MSIRQTFNIANGRLLPTNLEHAAAGRCPRQRELEDLNVVAFLVVSNRTVAGWMAAYRDVGNDGLRDTPHPGPKPKLSPSWPAWLLGPPADPTRRRCRSRTRLLTRHPTTDNLPTSPCNPKILLVLRRLRLSGCPP